MNMDENLDTDAGKSKEAPKLERADVVSAVLPQEQEADYIPPRPVRKPLVEPNVPQLNDDSLSMILTAMKLTGTITGSARQLGISYGKISRWVKLHPEHRDQIAEALREGQEFVVDNAAQAVIEAMADPTSPRQSLQTSKWWLTNSPEGKNRGFGTKTEVENTHQIIATTNGPDRPASWDEYRKRYADVVDAEVIEGDEGGGDE